MFVIPYATRTRATVPAGFGRALDRLFDDALQGHPAANLADSPAPRSPALDVLETDAAYIATFDLPGAAKEQLKVSVEGRRLTLETADPAVPAAHADTTAAQAPDAAVPAAPRTLYRERSAARYARTVVLPAEVDATAVQARYENGVLTLNLPKRMASGATQVHIA